MRTGEELNPSLDAISCQLKEKLKRRLVALALCFFLGPTARADGLFPLVVQLDWIQNAQFAGLLVAKEKGWYAQQGLDVDIRPVNPLTLDTVGPVVTDRNVIGCADGMALLRARQAGQPILAFATTLQASPLGIVTLRSSHLDQIEKLAGKTIGLHAYDRPQLNVMLHAHGLSLDMVRVVEVGDDTTSLAAGKIDAQVIYLLDEKVAMEQKGMALNVFPGYANGYKTYSQVFFARSDWLAAHRDALAKFLEVTNRGWKEAFSHPEETAAMIVARYLPEQTKEYQSRSIKELQGFAVVESPRLGAMRLSTWQKSCLLFGLDPKLAQQLADFSVLRAVYGKC